ncbi:MAG: hypothetical protein ACTSPY_08020 [Candidatus Helarchaeota archaeon]
MTNKGYDDFSTTKYIITAEIEVNGIVENLYLSQIRSIKARCCWSDFRPNRRFIG